MTTKGVILEQADRSVTRIEPHGGGANAAIKAETAAEKTFWQKSSPWVHGVLGVASFVPGLSDMRGLVVIDGLAAIMAERPISTKPPSASEKVNCKPFSLQYSVDSSKKRHFFKDSGAPNIG